MDIEQAIRDLKPLSGQVVPIRTVQETRPPEEFADAFVAEVNVKSASQVIKALDSAFPKDPSLPLAHLRRFAKREILPPPLRTAIESNSTHRSTSAQTIFVLISPPLPDITALKVLLAPFAPQPTPVVTNDSPKIDEPDEASSSDHTASNIHLHPIKIPLYPPFNIAQAETWTKTLWPVVFNPAAPRSTVAPPPQTLKRAQESIEPRAGYYLSLARKVAEDAEQSGLGRGVGAVVVDPAIEAEITGAGDEVGYDDTTARWDEAVLTVAGDARYSRSEAGALPQAQLHGGVVPNPATKIYNADVEGGPELHALMRAVDLIARWRREHDSLDGMPVSKATSESSKTEQEQQRSETLAELSPFESYFLYRHRPDPSNPPLSSSPPLKRKHEQPNPESDFSIDTSAGLSLDPPHHPQLPGPPSSTTSPSISATTPVTRSIRTRSQGGYLCTDLDVYLSHEPCLCCSMGMLLSRFRAVIFPRRGRMESGGLASEPIVAPVADEPEQAASGGDPVDEEHERQYYGLHWRKELNWRALGFEFVEDAGEMEDQARLPVFHA